MTSELRYYLTTAYYRAIGLTSSVFARRASSVPATARARNANTSVGRRTGRTHRSHSNDNVGEQADSRELAQLRRRLRARQPEPPAGGLGTKQRAATTRCSVGYNGAALGGQAETGGTTPSLQAFAAVATVTNVTARSGKSNWSCAAQAEDPVAVASLGTEPARAGQAPVVAGHAQSGDEPRTPRDARALRSGHPAQPD